MTRLSLADIDELARLQRKIQHRSVLVEQLFECEKLGKPDEAQDWTVGDLGMRNALAKLLDDITDGSRAIAAIVNRDDQGGTK
jgi:hypothetical protein